VELVISDAHGGIKAAIAAVLAEASWQRCPDNLCRARPDEGVSPLPITQSTALSATRLAWAWWTNHTSAPREARTDDYAVAPRTERGTRQFLPSTVRPWVSATSSSFNHA
jgi:hypothetical protein